MESPAARLERVLLGVVIALVFLTSISISDGALIIFDDDTTMEDSLAMIFPILCIIIIILVLSLRRSAGGEYGSFFLDSWISREDEGEMISRLRKEQSDTSVDNMGGAWAELEKVHLERSLEEE